MTARRYVRPLPRKAVVVEIYPLFVAVIEELDGRQVAVLRVADDSDDAEAIELPRQRGA